MTASTFERALTLVLKHEGGWSDHPADPGSPTNLGVTIGTLSAVIGRPATKADVKALTPAIATGTASDQARHAQEVEEVNARIADALEQLAAREGQPPRPGRR